MGDATEELSVPALDRMHEILTLLSDHPEGIALRDLCRTVNMPVSTGYRFMGTLASHGYVKSGERKHIYVLGPMLIKLAASVLGQLDLAEIAAPFMNELSQQVDETVKLSVPKGNEVEVIARVESRKKMRIAVDIGERFPIVAGAASKAILAFQPAAIRESLLRAPLVRYTRGTITDPEELRKKLDEVVATHISYDEEEYIEGIKAVASPIMNVLNEPVGAISIAYFAAQDIDAQIMKERELAVYLAAQKISMSLGARAFQPQPGPPPLNAAQAGATKA